MNKELEMTPNVLVEFLQKPASEFTKEDIIRYIYDSPSAVLKKHNLDFFIFFFRIFTMLI